MKALLASLLLPIVMLRGQTLTPEQLRAVGFEQKPGAAVPLDLTLRDEDGVATRLGSYFGERPVILTMADYQCAHLCNVVLNGLLESARDLRLNVGRDFEIIVVNIRPGAAPGLAAAKKRTLVSRYGRTDAEQGWHFLMGD